LRGASIQPKGRLQLNRVVLRGPGPAQRDLVPNALVDVEEADFGEQFDKANGHGQFDLTRDKERDEDRVHCASGPPRNGLQEAAIVLFHHRGRGRSDAIRSLLGGQSGKGSGVRGLAQLAEEGAFGETVEVWLRVLLAGFEAERATDGQPALALTHFGQSFAGAKSLAADDAGVP
jgi:hypothetical protein